VEEMDGRCGERIGKTDGSFHQFKRHFSLSLSISMMRPTTLFLLAKIVELTTTKSPTDKAVSTEST
jgi:hypothetical protein